MTANSEDWLLDFIQEVLKGEGVDLDSEETSRIVQDVIIGALPECAETIFGDLKSNAYKELEKMRKIRDEFETRIYERWKTAIDLLEIFINIALEVGAEFNNEHRDEAVENNDYLFEVLTRMHGRACQVSFEILSLLKSGYADGAFARWRTLYEIAIHSLFISNNGQDVAERFLYFDIIESFNQAEEYKKRCGDLGYEPLSEQEYNELKEGCENLVERYGKDFRKSYGWIPKDLLNDRKFSEVERMVNQNLLRPYYKLANNPVHAGPKGITFQFGLIKGSPIDQIILAGPSNYGLADPGQCAALSLLQVTMCLLLTRPTVERLITIKVLEMLGNEINETFCGIQFQMENEERMLDQ